eukprot:scaffold232821_cov32-Tisochrysis_lutea.AAC.2
MRAKGNETGQAKTCHPQHHKSKQEFGRHGPRAITDWQIAQRPEQLKCAFLTWAFAVGGQRQANG